MSHVDPVPRLRSGWAGQRPLRQPPPYLGCVYILTRLVVPLLDHPSYCRALGLAP